MSQKSKPAEQPPNFDEKLKQISLPSAGALTYNGYLKVEELKQLQICRSAPAHHDEPLFIIIHQAYELWFKLILHELDTVFSLLDNDKVRRGSFYMRRTNEIMKLLVQQIHILETMKPTDFLGFRNDLSPASGFGSSQFREIEFVAGAKNLALLEHFKSDPAYPILNARYKNRSLGQAFYELLERQGFKLPVAAEDSSSEEHERISELRIRELSKLYMEEDKYGELHDFAETLIEFDELLFLWRVNHVTVVERMIGFKAGTGGSEGVGYLQSTLVKRCFPDLWKLRTYLDNSGESSVNYGSKQQPLPRPQGGGCPFS